MPSPGPTSTIRSPGCDGRGLHDALQDSAVGEVVLRERSPRRQPVAAQVALHGLRAEVDRRRARTRSATGRSDRELQGGTRVEATVGEAAGRERDARPPRRSWPRCPCTGRAAARGAARPGPAGTLGDALAQDAVGCHAATEDDVDARPRRAGGPQRLRREHVDDGVLEGPGELGDLGRGQLDLGRRQLDLRRGRSATSFVGRSRSSASPTSRRAAVFRPLNEKSKESPSQARGKRRSCRDAPAAAAMMAGPPG